MNTRDDVHYRERGEGPILLCLHGLNSSSASFEPQLAGLGRDIRVVAWDAPGYGRSTDPSGALNPAGYVDAVVRLIDRLGAPVHLLGLSWGAAIACEVAQQHPQLLRSLILIGGGRGDKDNPAGAAALRGRVRRLEEVGSQRFAEESVPRLLSSSANPQCLSESVAIAAADVRFSGYSAAVESLIETDLRPTLARIDVPTLLLCGEEDPINGEEESRALQTAIRDSVRVTVDGAGHLANQDRPTAVNEWIAAYLDIIENLDSTKEPIHVGQF
ncbi:hypothetical protein CH272_28020 [Rhodococcus sp. 05-340-1]|uniref:alpha/beta fold hydrolase n=1 Tax=unclassified Rhodococcus (in: high G+C Gram-positive bacteria) TaxID=192944 RepID=UPI000B9AD4FB|nr:MULTISPECIES: alpha/beta hydrolase [unclassified Rhodococcus (in: high G+C Gram-positive bacteria)]OZD68862.1 hypothetical protein CH271_10740 [Rhodococcus sp. 05-340-2]OZD69335.1 hypothetical protein CH272_28020 [Rhodococcus sp. 05-340-1]